ncbi:aminoglycoside phosphotransferase family protein [Streptomyces sp. NPDC093252]|uniref:aminoglycoside phosphotransferase family protein n=1 Tax=Streptomyces sp. NPDC093252 TaxID=3154980 RepID=UPI00344279A9
MTTLLSALTTQARTAAHDHPTGAPGGNPEPTTPATLACVCGTRTLADRPDATVVRHAATVAKAHAPGTDPARLTTLLATAARLPAVFVPPLRPDPVPLHGRLVTFWPYGTPVDPENPDAAPWEAAATLLAHLHRTPVPTRPSLRTPPPVLRGSAPALPSMRGPEKTARAVERLRAARTPHPATPAILRAWAALPGWARADAPMEPGATTLCHGDLHLGQLVRHPAPDGPWRLIDVDDLGVGVPAWDLARPAAWYACGLLAPDEWTRFLDAYRAAGGPAVPPDGDPWPALDVPARALTVQTAATTLAKALAAGRPLDEVEESVIDAAVRIAALP